MIGAGSGKGLGPGGLRAGGWAGGRGEALQEGVILPGVPEAGAGGAAVPVVANLRELGPAAVGAELREHA